MSRYLVVFYADIVSDMEPFTVEVPTHTEAIVVLHAIADFSIFLNDANLTLPHSHAGVIKKFNPLTEKWGNVDEKKTTTH